MLAILPIFCAIGGGPAGCGGHPGVDSQLPIIYVREDTPAYIHNWQLFIYVRENAPAYIHNRQLCMCVDGGGGGGVGGGLIRDVLG